MPIFGKDFIFVTQFIRNLRGGSQPILAQASDGHTYVVKFANNLQGQNLLFNESAGTELYRACGLPVPEWRPLVVSEDFIDRNPDCWIQTPEGRLRPASGLCFGSRYLGEDGKRILEVLPRTSFERVRNPSNFWLAWLIDVCAEHVDNRQALFAEDARGWLNTYFVDFGHFFGGPKADQKKNFRASRYLDSRIYMGVTFEALVTYKNALLALDTDTLWVRIGAIPADWCNASALDGFARCLDRLANPFLVQNILDTVTDAIERTSDTNAGFSQGEREPLFEVLRPRVQGSGGRQSRAHHSACA